MKRFFLFFGDSYYPDHGWKDFRGSFDTQEEAEAALTKEFHPDYDHFPGGWWQVVDTSVPKIVAFRWEKYPIQRTP